MLRPWAATILLGTAVAALAIGPRAAIALPSAAAQPHPAVVRVVTRDRDGATSLGSGVLVATSEQHGLVVTNWHVVRDAVGPVTVIFPDGFRSGATVLRTDRDWDLAALAIWRPSAEPVPISSVAPQRGEPLAIAGYGPSGRYRVATGRCTQYYPPSLNLPAELVELSAAARQGDSGGPILNSRGELAGVLFGTADGRTMGSYCGRVRQFLGTITDEFRDVPAGDGTMIAARTPVQSPATGTQQKPTSPPVATIRPVLPEPPSAAPSNQFAQSEPPWRPVAPTTPGAPNPAQPGPGQSDAAAAGTTAMIGWRDIAGNTLGDQAKTVLAAFGALAVFLQAVRLLGSGEKS